MPASIGINLRVTGHCRQGGRKYMEDFFSVAYQQTEDERDLEYAFFGIYDGHGGAEAAAFAKEHLMDTIVKHKTFWSENDEDVLKAIKDGYIATHYAMWKEQEKWPKTASGLPSTAGTTASVAFIRRGKIYIGHVGDSGIILGYQMPGSSEWKAKPLTKDHKPESLVEMTRIESCGGKVVSKSGVPRVVWNRPRIGHKGPVRRSTPIDEIPFLAVARSLGDLWSYNSQLDEFVVSPDPDCSVIPIDVSTFRCLIFGTDGLYNMLSPQAAVNIVQTVEKHNDTIALSDTPTKGWINPSKCLVERALERWSSTKMRADNTSVVTIMLDPPGPPKTQVLRNRKKSYIDSGGLQILTRYENQPDPIPFVPRHVSGSRTHFSNCPSGRNFVLSPPKSENPHLSNIASTVSKVGTAPNLNSLHTRFTEIMEKLRATSTINPSTFDQSRGRNEDGGGISELSRSNYFSQTNFEQFERRFIPKLRESTSYDPRCLEENIDNNCTCTSSDINRNLPANTEETVTSTTNITPSSSADEKIQINEISSSSNDCFENLDREDIVQSSSHTVVKENYRNLGKTKRVMDTTHQVIEETNKDHRNVSDLESTVKTNIEAETSGTSNTENIENKIENEENENIIQNMDVRPRKLRKSRKTVRLTIDEIFKNIKDPPTSILSSRLTKMRSPQEAVQDKLKSEQVVLKPLNHPHQNFNTKLKRLQPSSTSEKLQKELKAFQKPNKSRTSERINKPPKLKSGIENSVTPEKSKDDKKAKPTSKSRYKLSKGVPVSKKEIMKKIVAEKTLNLKSKSSHPSKKLKKSFGNSVNSKSKSLETTSAISPKVQKNKKPQTKVSQVQNKKNKSTKNKKQSNRSAQSLRNQKPGITTRSSRNYQGLKL